MSAARAIGKPFRRVVEIKQAQPKGFIYVLECGHENRHRHTKKARIQKCKQCPDSWSGRHERCIICGSTDRAHAGGGKCHLCARRGGRLNVDWEERSRNRVHAVDDTIFDVPSEVGAYLLGVLYAEGHIDSNGNYGIKIGLSIKDIEWLEQLKSAFKYDGEINTYWLEDEYGPREIAEFKFSSRRIHKRLTEHGMKQRIHPYIPDSVYSHFIRGLFDGDGSAYITKATGYIQASFTGKKELLEGIRDRISRLAGTSCRMQVLKLQPGTPQAKPYKYAYGTADTRRFAKWIYKDATICLARKRELLERTVESVVRG